ncbi:energy transducer TonB [Sphingomonas sp. G124]|uniref:Energy transducer TonB n=1 Tax=Sphingomonas cremea TaxID=2904799 RepID=A0A9X1QJY9_9SPHN|nr:energy transducer TonB [Sphingomonas cremea]MCF2514490.1 energy transducer TonB [Sphingomonas cremea]
MSYANRKQMSSNRTAAIIIVALIHIALGYALVTGLAYNVIKKAAEDLKTFDVEDEPPPPPEEPPPPPDQNTPPPPQVVAPPPIVRTNSVAPPVISVPVAPPPVITERPAPPAPSAPPPPRVSQAAKAKANLTSLFSTDDYPQSAIRNEEQGTTAVRLSIGTDGRVTDCSITGSSGSSALDAATCNILRRRARFTPAKDQAGNPISDTFSQRIRWELPED